MGRYIEIETRNLASDRKIIEEELKGIKVDLKSLMEQMKELNATWEGPTNRAYQNQVTSDIENLNNLCEGLSQFLNCMIYAEKKYVRCEKNATIYVDRIRV